MSRITSAPEHDSYVWSIDSQKDYHPPRSSQGHPSQVNVQLTLQEPIQRFDSTDTSNYSNEPFATYSTSSSFNFDHPTPQDSLDENTFHTPEIEDLLWQETYIGNSAANENQSMELPRENGRIPAPLDPDEARLYIDALPSPQSTNISTPEASGHTRQHTQSTLLTTPVTSPQQSKIAMASLETETSQAQDSTAHLHTPAQPHPHLTSPVIQISKHSRGDSPARSVEGPRIAKKRSVSNLSQGGYFPDVEDERSILRPPSHSYMQGLDEDGQDRTGVAPTLRSDQIIPSIQDMGQQREHEQTVAEVQSWLERATLGPADAERHSSRNQSRPDRIRSRSTGARPNVAQRPILRETNVPGPGLLIDERSDDDYSSDATSEYSIHPDHHHTVPVEMPPRRDSRIAPDDIDPLPSQFFRRDPWQDSFPAYPPDDNMRSQPDTAAEAIYKYALRAKNWETASRAATWGTGRRRLSDTDIDSIIEQKTRHQSLSNIRNRGQSFLRRAQSKAQEQILKRSPSHSKRQYQGAELQKVQSPEPIEDRPSLEATKQNRRGSYTKQGSPSLSAGILGATNQMAVVGAGSATLSPESEQPQENIVRRIVRRVRSRSDVNRSPKSPTQFFSMVAQTGVFLGAVASPTQENSSPVARPVTSAPIQQDTPMQQDVEVQTQTPIKMSLSPQPTNIIPNLDGFKVQIRELNPRLMPYLVERVAQDQGRRYKRLVKNRVDHMATVQNKSCSSRHLCATVGGQAELLPARNNGGDTTSTSAQFKVTPTADSDNDDSTFDGIVTPAAFPEGIPLPPTKKLPARFECPLCFQVKTFQKPSDWTKHVHEDVQPFTCTFLKCPEPKSFKRKADWVRHENERHRHLEWWKCNISDCSHLCYRKDNFVQHLVREHKRKEPKSKSRGNGSVKAKGKTTASTFNVEEQEFWNSVDRCRHESPLDAKDEACKFCGNCCTSWKKLAVHVGKHMEQIAMPVIGLAEQRKVTKDTIISPVEPLPSRSAAFMGADSTMMAQFDSTMSPFTQSGASNYQSSSAGHSPAVMHGAQPAIVPSNGYLGPIYNTNGMHSSLLTSAPYTQSTFAGSLGYTTFSGGYDNTSYASYNGQHVLYPQNQVPQQIQSNAGVDANGNFLNMQSTFDEQSPYFSSPEQSYATYQTDVLQPNMNGMMGQFQTPVTTQDMTGDMFVHARQHGDRGQHYYDR